MWYTFFQIISAFLLFLFITTYYVDAEYPPSGFRPEGEPFTLPPSRINQPRNPGNRKKPSQNQYDLPQTQYGVPNKPQLEYGAPNVPNKQYPDNSDIDTQRVVDFNQQTERDNFPPFVQINSNNARYPQTQYATLEAPQRDYNNAQSVPGRKYVPQNIDTQRVLNANKQNNGQGFTTSQKNTPFVPNKNKQTVTQNNKKRISSNQSFGNNDSVDVDNETDNIPAQEYGPPQSTTRRTIPRTRKPLRTQEATTRTKPVVPKIPVGNIVN